MANAGDHHGTCGVMEDHPWASEPHPAEQFGQAVAPAPKQRAPTLEILEPIRWQGQPLPERRWLVPGIVPIGAVTMLGGDGGLGKSLLALQLAAACATGTAWLGRQVDAARILVVCCEDHPDELQIRLADILKHIGRDFADLDDMRLVSRVGQDNNLVGVQGLGRSSGRPTPFYHQIMAQAVEFGARLVILDSLHDLFAGNENSRPEVRAFVSLLQRIAIQIDGAVVLLAHPSLAGMTNGTGSSGSTAWNAAVRSRLYLTRPKEDEDGDRDRRELRTMKANYGALDRPIKLRWHDGVFVGEDQPRPRGGIVDQLETENIILGVLRHLIGNGDHIAASEAASTGLAAMVKKSPAGRHLGFGEITSAQARMLQAGKLVKVELGPPSKRRIYVRPTDTLYPEERPK